MTKTNNYITIETKSWVRDKAMLIDLLLKDDSERSQRDRSFINYVHLKQSFIDQAIDMVGWINEEKLKDHGLLESYAYFMDNGYKFQQPDRYDYRTAVFNDLRDAILEDKPFNPYEIVEQWDMWYHS
tara:strand:+ start:585 stop:965 length:381 start_codon:yes stop_codon:yes gene_type:complete